MTDPKIIIVTGANSGIGKETAKTLAATGAKVIMGCRHPERAKAALNEVIAESGNDSVEVIPLDLASMASVREFADEFKRRFDRLDVLVNNAGLVPPKKAKTKDGFEMQIGVNHLGHFLLTKLLLPELEATKKSRIINVASMIHHIGRIDFDSFRGEKPYNAFRAYGQSKLANVLFTRELAKRFDASNISSYSLHPGGVGTNIAGRGFFMRNLYRLLGGFLSPARGAKTSTYLATAPGIEDLSGNYFNEFCKMKSGSALSQNKDLAEKLWEESEALVADYC